jgi:predicted outer membrane lipoprotein
MLLISFFGGWLIPRIAKDQGIGNAFGVGAISCTFSLIMALSLTYMDKKAKKSDKKMLA